MCWWLIVEKSISSDVIKWNYLFLKSKASLIRTSHAGCAKGSSLTSMICATHDLRLRLVDGPVDGWLRIVGLEDFLAFGRANDRLRVSISMVKSTLFSKIPVVTRQNLQDLLF